MNNFKLEKGNRIVIYIVFIKYRIIVEIFNKVFYGI